jgi:hypothetical protein
MQTHDEEMESYLKEFSPRAIRPLEQEQRSPNFWPGRLAAAAVIVLAGGFFIWATRREAETVRLKPLSAELQRSIPSSHKPLSTFLLTRLALDDNKRLDAELTEESRRVLPSLQGQESTLQVFAGE